MNASISPADIGSASLDEEIARAELYGVLARLFYAPPDPAFAAGLRAAATEAPMAGAFLETPWRDLVAAARDMDDPSLHDEYEALFGGLGKPEVYLYGSHYLNGFLNEKSLVGLRNDLAALGLARDPAMPETEDHIAYLCEVMRYLIAGEDAAQCHLANQRKFFGDHLLPWVPAMCDALSAHPRARFYAALSEFTRAFASVEAQGFDMLP
ncbi:molecular chaperone TorD family protein [Pigmentiphaga sp.]|uniref:TorD/DmsD family molecular chaperone n=1 Tax=Pigmentiphaga sp. TaxID=1977564 RepID=UPI00128C2912|nr:molecular chaperone TorD family protein [Pigmentiphaga sp.]MPS27146.1 molecular chaperone [Alcaligenaceae bacterium SAGV5]MPS51701.1 molecular chaperone [Alcaligenaceae bacterium SAGV3]MPT55865.1 molecular chaperone [Alcaligenaceae bacterium]